jgi:hypothetical protein
VSSSSVRCNKLTLQLAAKTRHVSVVFNVIDVCSRPSFAICAAKQAFGAWFQVVDPLLEMKGKQGSDKAMPWSKARAKALKRSNPWAGGFIT